MTESNKSVSAPMTGYLCTDCKPPTDVTAEVEWEAQKWIDGDTGMGVPGFGSVGVSAGPLKSVVVTCLNGHQAAYDFPYYLFTEADNG